MMDDRDVLRQYVQTRDERAFAELVRRHIDLVHTAALRQVREPATAQDVTQDVFVLLATQAHRIRKPGALAGWLLVATRGLALNAIRANSRRRHHEAESAAMKREDSGASSDWDQIRLVLDEAVADLRPAERNALALRYFQGLQPSEVAAALGVSPAAAQKRVSRAVSQLRRFFASRGVTTTEQALAGALSLHAVSPAPQALSVSIAKSALSASRAIFSPQTAKGVTAIMAMTKTQAALVATAAIVVFAGVAAPVMYFRSASGRVSTTVDHVGGQPTTQKWQSEFRDVYALKPDEAIRHIGPPFVSARREFFLAGPAPYFNRSTPKNWADIGSPTSVMFICDDHDIRWQSFTSHEERSLASVLHEVAGVWPQETDIPRDKLIQDVTGDWVVRNGATTEQKMAGLAKAVFGSGMSLKSMPTDREVIVASGQMNYKPLPHAVNPDRPSKSMQIFLYRGSDHLEPTNRSMAQTPTDFVQQLGEMLGRPVVIEAQMGERRPVMICTIGDVRDFIRAGDSSDGAVADELLKIASEQTSLQFTRQHRNVPTWRLVHE